MFFLKSDKNMKKKKQNSNVPTSWMINLNQKQARKSQWTKAFPTQRAGVGVCYSYYFPKQANGAFIACGGWQNPWIAEPSRYSQKEVIWYDEYRNEWKRHSDMPRGRGYFAFTSLDHLGRHRRYDSGTQESPLVTVGGYVWNC